MVEEGMKPQTQMYIAAGFHTHTYIYIYYINIYLRAAAPAADPGSKYGGLATFGYLLKQGNLGTNLRNISIAPCES